MTADKGGGWVLAVDFGTTFTCATVVREGRVSLLSVEDATRMPSSVFRTREGTLVAGRLADNQAVLDPSAYEPTPKRRVGQSHMVLGGARVAVEELIATVLGQVGVEATRQAGGQAPAEVRLSHPAGWAGPRRAVLEGAARRAGLARVVLVPEPVAAAVHYAALGGDQLPRGAALGIYDLGGGTFDAAVVEHTDSGFAVAGPPLGLDPLGGVDFDHRLLAHLGERFGAEAPAEWAKLTDPPDLSWARHRADFLTGLRNTKEALSRLETFPLLVPGLDREVLVTRGEFEALIRADLEHTVDIFAAAVAAANRSPGDLKGIYLVGGSSRIPLVSQLVWERLGVQPTTLEDPKAVVAQGAAVWTPPPPTPKEGADEGSEGAQVPGPPQNLLIQARQHSVVLNFQAPASDGGAAVTAYVAAASPGGATAEGAEPPLTISDLHGARYSISVRAKNAIGKGPPAEGGVTVPHDRPSRRFVTVFSTSAALICLSLFLPWWHYTGTFQVAADGPGADLFETDVVSSNSLRDEAFPFEYFKSIDAFPFWLLGACALGIATAAVVSVRTRIPWTALVGWSVVTTGVAAWSVQRSRALATNAFEHEVSRWDVVGQVGLEPTSGIWLSVAGILLLFVGAVIATTALRGTRR